MFYMKHNHYTVILPFILLVKQEAALKASAAEETAVTAQDDTAATEKGSEPASSGTHADADETMSKADDANGAGSDRSAAAQTEASSAADPGITPFVQVNIICLLCSLGLLLFSRSSLLCPSVSSSGENLVLYNRNVPFALISNGQQGD
jgi:hypothetical protein